MADTTELDTPLIGGDSLVQTTNGTGGASTQTEIPPDDVDAAKVEAEGKASEEEVDYKAKFEAADTALTKATNDLKSLQTGRQRTAERDAKMDEILDGQRAVMDSNAALIKALNSGETEGLPAELDKIDQESRGRQSLSRIRVQAEGLREAFVNTGKDAEGNMVVDVEHDSRFTDVVGNWNRISGDADLEPSEKLAQLTTVVTQANVKMSGIWREESKKAVDEARNAGKRALEETGVLDTDIGGRTGAADGSVQALIGKFNTGARVTKAEQTRIDEHLEALDDTPGSALG